MAAVGTLTASWTVEIEASRERVYAVAADVPASPVWQPALETVETLESDEQGRAILVDTSSDAVVKKTRQRLRFSYDEEPADDPEGVGPEAGVEPVGEGGLLQPAGDREEVGAAVGGDVSGADPVAVGEPPAGGLVAHAISRRGATRRAP